MEGKRKCIAAMAIPIAPAVLRLSEIISDVDGFLAPFLFSEYSILKKKASPAMKKAGMASPMILGPGFMGKRSIRKNKRRPE